MEEFASSSLRDTHVHTCRSVDSPAGIDRAACSGRCLKSSALRRRCNRCRCHSAVAAVQCFLIWIALRRRASATVHTSSEQCPSGKPSFGFGGRGGHHESVRQPAPAGTNCDCAALLPGERAVRADLNRSGKQVTARPHVARGYRTGVLRTARRRDV